MKPGFLIPRADCSDLMSSTWSLTCPRGETVILWLLLQWQLLGKSKAKNEHSGEGPGWLAATAGSVGI